MSKPTVWTQTIDDTNAPARLRGRVITVTLTPPPNGSMEIKVDLNEDYTAQEQAYLRWRVGEFLEDLRPQVPGITFGDPTMICQPSTRESSRAD